MRASSGEAGVDGLETRFDARIAALRADIYRALWMQAGAIIAVMTAMIAVFKLFGRHPRRRVCRNAPRREADRRHAEAMQASAERHAENMQASAERHAENMQASAERHAENMTAINAMAATLAETTAALKVIVERTVPGAGREPV